MTRKTERSQPRAAIRAAAFVGMGAFVVSLALIFIGIIVDWRT